MPKQSSPSDFWESCSTRIHTAWTSLRRPWISSSESYPSPFDEALVTPFGRTLLVTVVMHDGEWSTWADMQLEDEGSITFWLKGRPTLTVAKQCVMVVDRQDKKAIVASAVKPRHS